MAEFNFLQNPLTKKWVVIAPRRAKRPDASKGEPRCPFCPGGAGDNQEVYKVPDVNGHGWAVRVLYNKFPFAPIHEVIIHSPDHTQNFDHLPQNQIELILQTYRQRYQLYEEKGQVIIFHNRGKLGGESLPHPHSQLVVIPPNVHLDIAKLDPSLLHLTEDDMKSAVLGVGPNMKEQSQVVTGHFYLFCPESSSLPDEVWIAPKRRGKTFGEITNSEITDLASTLRRLIQIFDIRHTPDFPFNFYIPSTSDWYIRIVPRLKIIGGFELATGVYVNTQDPKETIAFIKKHFDPSADEPDVEKIKTEDRAEYERRV